MRVPAAAALLLAGKGRERGPEKHMIVPCYCTWYLGMLLLMVACTASWPGGAQAQAQAQLLSLADAKSEFVLQHPEYGYK